MAELTGSQVEPSSGQVVIEVLIAVAVAAVVIGAGVMVMFGGRSLSVKGGQESRAIHFAQAELEEARADARNDYASLVSSSSTEGIYTKELIVEEEGADTKKVTGKVSWRDALGAERSIELVALFTNWQLEEATGGDTGGGGVSGDWKNPQTLGAVDLGPGNEATGLDVIDNIVYLAAEASDVKKDDFFIVDASDGQSPSVIASTSTGPGLSAVDATTEFAFAANQDANDQLQVIDVRNQNNPQLYATLTLSNALGAEGKTIFYRSEKVYMGTDVGAGTEFHVVDVSDPANPTVLGDFEIGASVGEVVVRGDIAYLATSDSAEEIKVLDVADPATISQIGSFDAPGSAEAFSLFLSGTELYVGRAESADANLLVLDVADVTNITLLGEQPVNGSVFGLYVREELAFVGTDEANEEFQVWNVDDPQNITFWSSFNFPQEARDIDYENNRVYTAVRSNDALRIITSQ